MKKIVFLCILACLVFSQEFDERDPRAIIEKVKIYRLTQELDLTTEQAIEFFPKLNDLQKIEKEFGDEKMRLLAEMKSLLREGAVEEDILKAVSKYENAHKDKVEKQLDKLKEVWQILTPVQRAKFLIFREEFNREIREMIKQIKKHR